MKRPESNDRAANVPMTSQDVSALIGPIIGFLHESGFSKKTILAECRAAVQKSGSKVSKLPVTHVEFGKDAIDIVNRWLRDPQYLNRHGRPDELPFAGAKSLTSLVRDCRVEVSPNRALLNLLNFKMVTQVASKKYRLLARSMTFWHSDYLPFEPNFRFLIDATRAALSRLQQPKSKLFWQCADNPRIHPRLTKDFLSFVKQRGLSFMHEMNDWLDEHDISDGSAAQRKAPRKRLGVSVFSIVSDP
ncbi:MAG: hypothetical protein ACRES2_03635 [Steroidobacteraceae bacterium]